jgi:glycosyltransferase involved in cell wall biosynthesis
MTQRPRVLLLIPHLGGGGAERVTALLTRGLSNRKYELHLGLITQSMPASEFVPAGVPIHGLGASRVRSGAISLLRLVRRLQPDLIVSGMAHLNFLVLLLRPLFPRKTRVVIRQNATVSADLHSGRLPAYTRLLYRLLYPSADRVVCQTRAMADDLVARSGVCDGQVLVLPNPVDAQAIRGVCSDSEGRWKGSGPHLLAVGRLSPEKGFDLLLQAFSSLRIKFPAAELTILGKGPEALPLRKLRSELRLGASVSFPGYVPHPENYFPGATLFVLPSRHDGLPNTLLEAAAGGLPLVACPCSDGVVHLLRGKRGVWLADIVSASALTGALLSAIDSLCQGQRFAHPWIEEYRMDYAIRHYERLIDETLQAQ